MRKGLYNDAHSTRTIRFRWHSRMVRVSPSIVLTCALRILEPLTGIRIISRQAR